MRLTSLISLAVIALTFTAQTAPAQPQPPDTLWTRTFGGDSADYCQSVHQTGDGGFIAGGYTKSFGAGNYDVYLVKTDAGGNEEWSRTIGGNSWDRCNDLQITSDGGYIIVGNTYSFGAGEDDVYLVKTDSLGNEEWFRTYGDRRQECGFSVQQTNDAGYIIVGYTQSYGIADQSVYLIKTDSLGNEIWYRTFGQGNMGVNYGLCVCQTSDGGYIITGATSPTIGGYDVLLLKTDSLGNEEWRRTFGGGYNDFGYDLKITADGGYIIAGSYGLDNSSDALLIKTDSLGNIEWSRSYSRATYDEANSVDKTLDGGYIFTGFNGYPSDLYIVKTDNLGNEEWSQTFNGISGEHGESIEQTTDGGCIVGGWTGSYGAGGADLWFIRFEGYLTFTLNPLQPVINIPSSGGSFDFTVSIENLFNHPVFFDAWSEVELPNSRILGPLIIRRNLTVSTQDSLSRQLGQYVPGNAPAGYYRYIGKIGTYPHTVILSDGFEFVKRP